MKEPRPVRFAPEAVKDIERLRSFVVEAAVAGRVADRLLKAVSVLAEQPELGRRVEDEDADDLRELVAPFGRGAYILRYRIDDDAVVVARVWHSREVRE